MIIIKQQYTVFNYDTGKPQIKEGFFEYHPGRVYYLGYLAIRNLYEQVDNDKRSPDNPEFLFLETNEQKTININALPIKIDESIYPVSFDNSGCTIVFSGKSVTYFVGVDL